MVELEVICKASCKDAVLCDLYTLYPWAEIVPAPDQAAQSVLLAMPDFYGEEINSLNWYRMFP